MGTRTRNLWWHLGKDLHLWGGPCPQVQQDLLTALLPVYSPLTGFSHLRVTNHRSVSPRAPCPTLSSAKVPEPKEKPGSVRSIRGDEPRDPPRAGNQPVASAKGQQQQRSPVKPRDRAASQGCASSRVTGFVAGPCVTPVSDNTSAGGTFPQKGLCEGNCESCNPNGVSAFSAGIGKHQGVTKLRFLGGLSFNHSVNYSCQKLFPLPAVSAPSWDSPSRHAASGCPDRCR